MQILRLIYEDGDIHAGNFVNLPTSNLVSVLRFSKVETIVVGEVDSDGKVIWEKQFSAVTVMPSSFGKQS